MMTVLLGFALKRRLGARISCPSAKNAWRMMTAKVTNATSYSSVVTRVSRTVIVTLGIAISYLNVRRMVPTVGISSILYSFALYLP